LLFVCENNLYAMGTALERSESEIDIHAKASSYRIPSETVDGMDVVAVEVAARRAVEAIRIDGGPRFLECRTYRFRAHSMFDPQLYRDKAEVERWQEKDPVKRFRDWALAAGVVHDDDVVTIEQEVAAVVAAAVTFAEAGTWEPISDLLKDVGAGARP
jgi:TPP-dependent pyruvate/acetoin dehydrogenase alpha subunit